MTSWAMDLGTTNSGVARWDVAHARAELIELPGVCREPAGKGILDAPRMVPSVVHALEPDLGARIGNWPWLRRNLFVGRQALIGRPALERNAGFPEPGFAPSFKGPLATDPTRPVARLGAQKLTARDVARLFFRELFAEVHRATGERIRDLTLTVPIATYDVYRAELRAAAEFVGVAKLRFLDEPVAAAIGYGLGLLQDRRILVIDIGGGTLHAVLVGLSARGVEAGHCELIGKAGRPVGGNLVDRWLLEDVCAKLEIPLDHDPTDETYALWQRFALAEARRVKEAVHFEPEATFTATAPEELRGLRARLRERATSLTVRREDLTALLERRGFYTLLDEAIETALPPGAPPPDEVLLVGGSTLLPGVYPRVEARFGRDRIRGWQPFESVALGAAAFASGTFVQSDFIIHDYAIRTHDAKTQAPRHVVVVPAGTRFPTPPDLWKRQLIPTCSLGEPETYFKLVVCEIGRNGEDQRRFGWDASGTLTPLGSAPGAQLIVPLNETNPVLGRLDPPHAPSERAPRLEVAFGVNADRWLCTTVLDLKSGKTLLDEAPVVRLL